MSPGGAVAGIAPVLALALAIVPGMARAAGPAHPVPGRDTRAAQLQFADVPWLTPADSVVRLLTARGYRHVARARERDRLHWTGKLFDRFATVQGFLDESARLVRCEIAVVSPEEPSSYPIQRRIYDDVVTEMSAAYGPRTFGRNRFRFPYEKGDGREAAAFRDGLAEIRSVWEARGGDRLEIAMDRSMAVVVSYESSHWDGVVARKRQKRARDF